MEKLEYTISPEAIPKGFIIKRNEPDLITIEIAESSFDQIKELGSTTHYYLEDGGDIIKRGFATGVINCKVTGPNTLEIRPCYTNHHFTQPEIDAINEKLKRLNQGFQ